MCMVYVRAAVHVNQPMQRCVYVCVYVCVCISANADGCSLVAYVRAAVHGNQQHVCVYVNICFFLQLRLSTFQTYRHVNMHVMCIVIQFDVPGEKHILLFCQTKNFLTQHVHT